MNIGVMGGTFDPVHIGHLVIAEEARQQYNLKKVIFMPSGTPPHKDNRLVSTPEHRYTMTVLAVTNNPFFEVSRFEIDKNRPSYTIDTVRHLRETTGEGIKIFFITGADAILDIPSWDSYRELLDTCVFIAASRPGYPLEKLKNTVEPAYPGIMSRIHLLENPAMSVSSTFIRKRAAAGKTIKYLTPEAVEQYIHKYSLYVKK